MKLLCITLEQIVETSEFVRILAMETSFVLLITTQKVLFCSL